MKRIAEMTDKEISEELSKLQTEEKPFGMEKIIKKRIRSLQREIDARNKHNLHNL